MIQIFKMNSNILLPYTSLHSSRGLLKIYLTTKILKVLLLSSNLATYSVHRNSVDLINLTLYHEWQKLKAWRSSLWSFLQIILSLVLSRSVHLRILFSTTSRIFTSLLIKLMIMLYMDRGKRNDFCSPLLPMIMIFTSGQLGLFLTCKPFTKMIVKVNMQ